MEVEISRNKLQELAVQAMYSFLLLQESNVAINFEETLSNICNLPYEECDVYLKEVLLKALKNESKIIAYVQKFLRNWEFRRLNSTIQSILILAVYEYYLIDEKIDKAVIINNAVKLAKRYGDGGEKDYKFVNAVLENCLNETRTNVL